MGNEMSIEQRVRYLRKTCLKMRQADFAAGIGIKQPAVSSIERGVGLSDRNIEAICRVYNVNERWLREGKGPMMEKKRNRVPSCLHGITGDRDALMEAIIKDYAALPPEARRAVLNEFGVN